MRKENQDIFQKWEDALNTDNLTTTPVTTSVTATSETFTEAHLEEASKNKRHVMATDASKNQRTQASKNKRAQISKKQRTHTTNNRILASPLIDSLSATNLVTKGISGNNSNIWNNTRNYKNVNINIHANKTYKGQLWRNSNNLSLGRFRENV